MEQAAAEYLQKHKIQDLLNHCTESLIYHQPPRCIPHLVKTLTQIKETRDNNNISTDNSKESSRATSASNQSQISGKNSNSEDANNNIEPIDQQSKAEEPLIKDKTIPHPNINSNNAQAVFKMLDPNDHGFVAVSAMKNFLDIYGLNEFEDSKLMQAYQSGGQIKRAQFVEYFIYDLSKKGLYYADSNGEIVGKNED